MTQIPFRTPQLSHIETLDLTNKAKEPTPKIERGFIDNHQHWRTKYLLENT